MRLTLTEDLKADDGTVFEREVEFRLPRNGEYYLLHPDVPPIIATGPTHTYETSRIVLTPKKKPFWRLDPVATFDEATQSSNNAKSQYRLARDEYGDEIWLTRGALFSNSQWLRRTQHEERP